MDIKSLAGALCVVVITLLSFSHADAYSIRIDRFDVAGSTTFTDDFDDGAPGGWTSFIGNLFFGTWEDEFGNSFANLSSPGLATPSVFGTPGVIVERSDIFSYDIPGTYVQGGIGDFNGRITYEAVLPGTEQIYFIALYYSNAPASTSLTDVILIGLVNFSPEMAVLNGANAGLNLLQFHLEYAPDMSVSNITDVGYAPIAPPAFMDTIQLDLQYSDLGATGQVTGGYRFDSGGSLSAQLPAIDVSTSLINGYWDLGVSELSVEPIAQTTTVTLSDYLVLPNPGDRWTYTTTEPTNGMPPGTDFVVTDPWYAAEIDQLPQTIETGQAILIQPPNIYLYLDIIPFRNVPAGTFINLLRMTALDSNYVANPVNTLLGIDPSVNWGVTDVDWFALGIGQIEYRGVGAFDGSNDGAYELKSFAVSFLAPGWSKSDFHSLCTTPTDCTPTRAIEFDSMGNLYIEDVTDDESGQIDILKLDASSGYTSSSIFASYNTVYQGVTGLDFDDLGNLYVSERAAGGNAGIIRKIDVVTPTLMSDVMAFANHRPTGIDADTAGNLYYSARMESNGTWGKLFKIDPSIIRTELSGSTVATGIALDAWGNIFISTPNRTDLPLVNRSVYMFEAGDIDLLNPIRIATFHEAGGELAFDDAGDLYMISQDRTSIIQLSPDTDFDGVTDNLDNCILEPNGPLIPDAGGNIQRDTDGDGYGNICDPDFDNNGVVQAADLAYLKSRFFTADEHADLDGNGVVQAADLAILKSMFFGPPGPSGLVP